MGWNDESNPAGYAPWPVSHRRHSIFLPTLLVQVLAEREEAEKVAKRNAQDTSVEEKPTSEHVAASEDSRRAWEASVALDCYRVIPNWEQFASEGSTAGSRSSVRDKDIAETREKLRQQLLAKGPDRLLAAGGLSCEQRLNEIDHAQPNFARVVDVVRNCLIMGRVTGKPVRVPPILLLGPPGVGKTYFTHNLAEALEAPYGAIAFDQPTAGNQLRGSDKHWSNSESGLLFNLICLGTHANPVILLDELDKGNADSPRSGDALSQLHGPLESQTARKMVDISAEVEFDASLVTYIATANDYRQIAPSILSRFEVFYVEPPKPAESIPMARRIAATMLTAYSIEDRIEVDPKALIVLAALTPRAIKMTLHKAIAKALSLKRQKITDVDIWEQVGFEDPSRYLH